MGTDSVRKNGSKNVKHAVPLERIFVCWEWLGLLILVGQSLMGCSSFPRPTPGSTPTPSAHSPLSARIFPAQPIGTARPGADPACLHPRDRLTPEGQFYRTLVNIYYPRLSAKFGFSLPDCPVLFDQPTSSPPEAIAWATPTDAQHGTSGKMASCWISIRPDARTTYQRGQLTSFIVHELFHCFSAAAAPTVDSFNHLGKWIKEGMATWASLELVGSDPVTTDWWKVYLTTPSRQLFARENDALGFFAQLTQAGASPWNVVNRLFAERDDRILYHILADPGGETFLNAWASGYVGQPNLGPDWTISADYAPALGTTLQATPPLTAETGKSQPVQAPPFTIATYGVSTRTDVVHLQISGHARLHDLDGNDSVNISLGDAFFCSRQPDCTCPAGSIYHGPPLIKISGFYLALTGGTNGTSGTVDGLSLQDFCQQNLGNGSIGAPIKLCMLTAAQISTIIGETVADPVAKFNTNSRTGLSGVICQYRGPTRTVSLAIGRGPQAAATYDLYHENDKRSGTKEIVPVKGLGDKAYTTVFTGSTDKWTGPLYVLKGQMVLACGVSQTGTLTIYEPQEEKIARLVLLRQ